MKKIDGFILGMIGLSSAFSIKAIHDVKKQKELISQAKKECCENEFSEDSENTEPIKIKCDDTTVSIFNMKNGIVAYAFEDDPEIYQDHFYTLQKIIEELGGKLEQDMFH